MIAPTSDVVGWCDALLGIANVIVADFQVGESDGRCKAGNLDDEFVVDIERMLEKLYIMLSQEIGAYVCRMDHEELFDVEAVAYVVEGDGALEGDVGRQQAAVHVRAGGGGVRVPVRAFAVVPAAVRQRVRGVAGKCPQSEIFCFGVVFEWRLW